MSTGDFPRGKEFACRDCLLTNGHPDAVPQINFCASCNRTHLINRLYELDNVNPIPIKVVKALTMSDSEFIEFIWKLYYDELRGDAASEEEFETLRIELNKRGIIYGDFPT